MRVTQLINSNGNPAANHFVISTDRSDYLQSYNSIVARIHMGTVTLGADWDYSKTTLKHLKLFLNVNEPKRIIERKIKLGEYHYDKDLSIPDTDYDNY